MDEGAALRVEAPKGVLDLGKCLLNDTHVLRSFRITNQTDAAQQVGIKSDASTAVSVQLSNENLEGIPVETSLTASLQEERFNNVRPIARIATDAVPPSALR